MSVFFKSLSTTAYIFCWVEFEKIRLKMNKINKNRINENSMSVFLSSPFSHVMTNLASASFAEESASLTLGKRKF